MNREKKARQHKSWGDRIFLAIVYTTVTLVALLCAYPLYYTIIASVSETNAVFSGKVSLWPVGFQLDAYKEVMKNSTIWRGYANTIFYTVFGTLFNLFLTVPTAFALNRPKLWGRNILMMLFVFTMYFGGGMIPTYLLYKNMNLINTRWIMILSGGLSVYNLIVTRTYFQNNIPESLLEAAKIDGADDFFVFGKIALPLSSPIVAVMTLYYAVGHWSSYFNAMIYLQDSKLHPLQVVLRKILILNQSLLESVEGTDVTQETLMMAIRLSELSHVMKFALVFISSAPMLIAYPFVQKHFVKGIMVGSVKG